MFKLLSTPLILILFTASLANAQSSPPTEDEVISRGQLRGSDPAMDAFLRGDYATAEVEFQKKFEALRRNKRIKEDAFLQARDNLRAGDINNLSLQSASSDGRTASPPLTSASSAAVTVNRQKEIKGENIISSGRDIGVQLYMKGLSQIQLKKYDDAKASFKSALKLSKNIRLHDARLRLGLLELRDGRKDEAQRQLKKLKQLSKRCNKRCDAKSDIQSSIDTLGWALSKA